MTLAKPKSCEACPLKNEACLTRGIFPAGARVTFLSDNPSWASVHAINGGQRGLAFSGRNGLLLKKVVKGMARSMYSDQDVSFAMAYAAGSYKGTSSKEVLERCGLLWKTQWSSAYGNQSEPHVIVALGLTAVKSLGIKGTSIVNLRGTAKTAVIGNRQVTVIPAFSLNHIHQKPGLLRVFQHDINKALEIAYRGASFKSKPIEELAKDYVFPRTLEDVRKTCDEIIGYYDPEKQDSPWNWPITVDVETNTVRAFRPDAKVLMISFAWDDGKATAIMLDHPSTPYDAQEAWTHVRRVLESPKPKTFHNGKFDLQFLEQLMGIRVNNVSWDTMLAEHWLDEDKKGAYSLKVVAPIYIPEFSGYEDELKNQLAAAGAHKTESEDESVSDDFAGLDFWGERQASNNHYTVHPDNQKWVELPEFPSDADPALVQEYARLKENWFHFDSVVDKDNRTKTLRAWKKVAKNLGVPQPTKLKNNNKEPAKEDRGFADIDLNVLLPYAAADADATRQIQKRQYRRLYATDQTDDAYNVMSTIYVPATKALSRMEYTGAKIDYDLLNEYDAKLTDLLAEAKERIYSLTLQEFNLESPEQLGSTLISCGFPVLKETAETQLVSTAKDVMQEYQQMYASYDTEEPFEADGTLSNYGKLTLTESIMLYKAAQKMKNTFLRGIRSLSYIDGRIHSTFHLNGTATGRLSSAKLNLQNLPHFMCRITRKVEGQDDPVVIYPGFNVKALIIPDREDEVFWNMDISAAEIRVLAYYSQDKALINALLAGADTHTVFLTKIKHPELTPDINDPVFREKYDHYIELKKAEDPEIEKLRTAVKRCVFGTLYGAKAPKIAEQLGDSSEEGIAFAQEVIDAIFTAFPTIKAYVTNTEREVVERGKVRTVFGRYRRFWMAQASKKMLSAAKREAVNFKIQSTASDLVVASLSEIEPAIRELGGKVLLTVHDSMAGTIPRNRVKDLSDFFDKHVLGLIEDKFPWMPVPYKYDLEVGPNYGTHEKLEKYL